MPEFRTIYEEHFDFVWCSLRRLGVREADVSDMCQKVFLTAHAKLPEFEGRSKLSSWLYGICRRVASDYRRSASVRREVITDAWTLDRHADSEDGTERLDARRRAEVAEAILDKLPEEQRVVFVMFELEELSGPEIARQLEVSQGTVRSRLRLARETFSREVKRLTRVSDFTRREAG